jgi:amino acid adenylation domain-containing protein
MAILNDSTSRSLHDGSPAADTASVVPLPAMFSRYARLAPNATALVWKDRRYSYDQIDRQSSRLGRLLVTRFGGERLGIGVCLRRSPELVIAMLAILKAGYYYVPLEPALPSRRLEEIVLDSQVAAVICSSYPCADMHESIERMDIEGLWWEMMAQEPIWPASRISLADLAYLMYTSGSTGQPKGVPICHGSLANFTLSVKETPGIWPGSVIAGVASISFDMSILELLVPLALGGTVHLLAREDVVDPVVLARLLNQSGINWIQATPTMFRMLIHASWVPRRPTVLVSGGEMLPRDLANALCDRGELWNAYGPTEATVYCSFARIGAGTERIDIGEPILNTTLHVLNEFGDVTAPGQIGELYIAGKCLSPGYWQRPEVTAAAFLEVRDFSGTCIRYRTGDRAERLPGGRIVVLGRADSQVKLRGYRIELGEVETICRQHPAVLNVSAMVRTSAGELQQLALVYTCRAGTELAAKELQSFLSEYLPDYMVPAICVQTDALPMLVSGKLDRAALTRMLNDHLMSPGEPHPDLWKAADAPSTERSLQWVRGRDNGERSALNALETRMTAVWSDVLNVRVESRRANWFELGGTSLAAASLFTEIEILSGVRLPVSTLVETPTLGQLCDRLENLELLPPSSPLVRLREGTGPQTIFFVHPIGGNILIYRKFAIALDPAFSIYGIQAHGLDGLDEPLASIDEMADRYLTLIKAGQPKGPYLIAGFSAGGVVSLEIARRIRQAGGSVVLTLIDTVIAAPVAGTHSAKSRLWLESGRLIKRNYFYLRHRGVRSFAARKISNWSMRVRLSRPATAWAANALNVEEAFLLALSQYKPHRYDGSAVLLRARHGLCDREMVDNWHEILSGRLLVLEIPGTHDTIFDDVNLETLANTFNSILQVQCLPEPSSTYPAALYECG